MSLPAMFLVVRWSGGADKTVTLGMEHRCGLHVYPGAYPGKYLLVRYPRYLIC